MLFTPLPPPKNIRIPYITYVGTYYLQGVHRLLIYGVLHTYKSMILDQESGVCFFQEYQNLWASTETLGTATMMCGNKPR